MLIIDVYKLYGSWQEFARKHNFGSTTYQGWIRRGYIPLRTQELIELRTAGHLKASNKHTKPQKEVEQFKKKAVTAN